MQERTFERLTVVETLMVAEMKRVEHERDDLEFGVTEGVLEHLK